MTQLWKKPEKRQNKMRKYNKKGGEYGNNRIRCEEV